MPWRGRTPRWGCGGFSGRTVSTSTSAWLFKQPRRECLGPRGWALFHEKDPPLMEFPQHIRLGSPISRDLVCRKGTGTLFSSNYGAPVPPFTFCGVRTVSSLPPYSYGSYGSYYY